MTPIKRSRKGIGTFFEHLALGAGSYAALGAIAGPQHRWQVGVSGTALMSGVKEAVDAHDGKDTRARAAWHAFSILLGAGAVAAFWR